MDKLQDILTLAATVADCGFFAYLAVAFVSAALTLLRTVPYQAWK